MPFIVVLLGIGAVTWVLRETDLIIPVTVALVLFLLVMAVNPGMAFLIAGAIAALIVFAIIWALLPQVLGFILGALILVVCIVMAGAASAKEQPMDRDTCGEIVSDIAEMNYYAEGWKDLKPPVWDTNIRILLYKNKKEVEFNCANGIMKIEERDHVPVLEMDIKTR